MGCSSSMATLRCIGKLCWFTNSCTNEYIAQNLLKNIDQDQEVLTKYCQAWKATTWNWWIPVKIGKHINTHQLKFTNGYTNPFDDSLTSEVLVYVLVTDEFICLFKTDFRLLMYRSWWTNFHCLHSQEGPRLKVPHKYFVSWNLDFPKIKKLG